MRLYERLASAVIGTPLQGPAETLRRLQGLPHRLRHPELHEIHVEQRRIDAFLDRAISDGMNCIDVGAHLGSFLQRIVQRSPSGKHIAVEPVPYKADWLRKKFPSVVIHQVAVGRELKTVPFFYNERQSALSALRTRSSAAGIREIPIQCTTLDEIAGSSERVDFMKIDVEGAEYSLLDGGRNLVARDRPLMLFECTFSGLSSFGQTASELYALLTRDLGYRIYLIKNWLSDQPALTVSAFAKSMLYPFQAFNYVAVPHGTGAHK